MQMRAAFIRARLPYPIILEHDCADISWSSEEAELDSGIFQISVLLAPSRVLLLVQTKQSALQELVNRLQNHKDSENFECVFQEFTAAYNTVAGHCE